MLHALCVVKIINRVLQESPGFSAKNVKDGVMMSAQQENLLVVLFVTFALND